jgi:ABC-type arginine transport system permease subunit
VLELLPTFVPAFLAGLAVNFGVALWALVGGLLLGLPLAWARLVERLPGRIAGLVVAPLRTAPTFVVMFFLLNALPPQLSLLGWKFAMTPWLALMLSLAVYAAAYVSDNALEALRQLQAGSPVAALLFLTNLVRAFFVLVLSSGAGAAVGVVEAITVTLRETERLPEVRDRIVLMLVVMLFFIVALQTIYYAIDLLRLRLTRRVTRGTARRA